MNRRLLVIILGLFFTGVVIFIIFNVIKTEPPKNIVSNYYKALSENDFEKANSYLIDKDKKSDEQEDVEYFKDYVKSIKANVIEEKIENDISTVDVRISRIAFEDIFSEYIKEVMAAAFSGNEISDEQMKIKQNEFFEKEIKDANAPKVDKVYTISLNKIDGVWKIKTDANFQKSLTGLDLDSLENQESNSLNEDNKENISKEPLVTVEMIPYDIKINKPDSIGEIYMEATYKNNSEYTIKGYNLTILLKDKNETTYLSNYDTVLSGETSPKFESSGPQTQKLDDVEILKIDITATDKNGKEIYIEYDNKTETYNTY